jgi:drug/metabolite transporter (DMT)-like permease
MLAGGVLLAMTAAALGEFRSFHPAAVSLHAWVALLYLIVAGSVVAFTAYVWLIHHESPTKVGTYAYVNPLVAVALGVLLAGERVSMVELLAMPVIAAGVLLVMAHKS